MDHVAAVGGFKHCIFIVGYMQFVEGRHLHRALLCSTGHGASAVARPLDRRVKPQHLATRRATATVQTISNVTVEDHA